MKNSSPPSRRFTAIAGLFALLCVGACSHVAPYQREYLAHRCMDVRERDAMREQFYSHVYEAREGAVGMSVSAVGGCGCN
jgi:hypothetical protein